MTRYVVQVRWTRYSLWTDFKTLSTPEAAESFAGTCRQNWSGHPETSVRVIRETIIRETVDGFLA